MTRPSWLPAMTLPSWLPRGRRSIPFYASATVAAVSLGWLLVSAHRAGVLLPIIFGAALVLCGACAVLSWAFVVRHARINWRATPEGRYLMWSKLAMALLFTFTLLGQVLPVSLMVGAVLSVVLFGGTAVVLADLLVLQARAIEEARVARSRRAEQERLTAARVALLRDLGDEPPAG